MTENGALHRAARVLAAMFVVDAAAFLVVTFLWASSTRGRRNDR